MRVKAYVVAVLVAMLVLERAPAAERPNIIVIMTDDQDDMSSVEVAMPKTLRLMRRHGIRFTNSFVNFSACCPSRSSFLTGLAAHHHGVVGNKPNQDGGYEKFLRHESNTIAVWLRNAGYVTAMMGKYMNGYDRKVVPRNHVPPGWSEWHVPIRPKYYSYVMNENGQIRSYGNAETDYLTDVLTSKAVRFINHNAAVPFFLFVTPKAPHVASRTLPAIPAARHIGSFSNIRPNYGISWNEADVSDKPEFVRAVPRMDRTSRHNAITIYRASRESLMAVDDMVEAIIRALARKQLLLKTYIVFTSDNGFSYGAHRLIGKGIVYEESIRVPLIIRGPGIPSRETRQHLVTNLDVVATILDLAGVAAPHAIDGRSLLPIINNPAAPWRKSILIQGLDPQPSGRGRFYAIRTDRVVYAEHTSQVFGSEREYYRLPNDPLQLVNEANNPKYARNIAVLSTLLNRLIGQPAQQTVKISAVPPKTWKRSDYDHAMMADE